MGLNAYFTYQVVGYHGTGIVPYKIALTAVFVEGFIFMFLALTGMRQWLVRMIPATIKTACGVGIGLFLTEIGLSYSAGIGAVTGGWSTPTAIGGCPSGLLDDHGECTSGIMTNPAVGPIIIVYSTGEITDLSALDVDWYHSWRHSRRFPDGIQGEERNHGRHRFGVDSVLAVSVFLLTSLLYRFFFDKPSRRGTNYTYFPDTPAGNDRWDFFSKVVAFHPIQMTLAAQEWSLTGTNASQFALALVTFLYVDIIDCTATLYSMAKFCDVVDDDGDFPRSTMAYCTDAACISVGALFGCSPVTAFIESGAGIAEGGRTGLTAMTTGLCFLVSLFFAPILASIPPWATGSTLVLVSSIRMRYSWCDDGR
jgi:AGZA family xanthine/uracil permease-like MFS transporter